MNPLHAFALAAIVLAAVTLFVFGNFFLGDPDVSFRSSDANWADSENRHKGRDFSVILLSFERYKRNCSAPQAALLRTTRQHWLNAFAWRSYLQDPEWSVPYADPVPQIGNYYPPVTMKHCYNGGPN